jgi:hypothetical protein
MADAMILDTSAASTGVAEKAATETGKPQGEKPSRPKLYDQLSEPGKKSFDAARFGKLEKLDDLVAEVRRLDGEVGNGIRVPGKDATKEQWAAYRKAMQIPDAPEGYSLARPQLPNGLPYNEKLEKWFRQELFDAGVSNDAAQKMFNDWNQQQIESFNTGLAARQKAADDAFAKAATDAIEELKAEYKDDYPRMMQLRDAAVARFGGQTIIDTLRDAKLPNGMSLANDARIVKMFVEIGKRMDVDTIVPGDGGTGTREPRAALPRTPHGYAMEFPEMERDPRLRVKAE